MHQPDLNPTRKADSSGNFGLEGAAQLLQTGVSDKKGRNLGDEHVSSTEKSRHVINHAKKANRFFQPQFAHTLFKKTFKLPAPSKQQNRARKRLHHAGKYL